MSYQPNPVRLLSCQLNRRLKPQQGVVIIVALFIVALIATLSYAMMARLEKDMRRTTLLLRNTQAEFYAQGSIAWAIETLDQNWQKQKPNQLIDVMPIQSPIQQVNGYQIKTSINDLQGRFNLNNLSQPEAQSDFERLLQILNPKLTNQDAQKIILAIVDWLKPMTEQSQYDQYYISLPLPYRSSHRLIQTISELQLIKGMTPALFEALQPYVTALPVTTLINVTTASAPVLASLSPNMTLATAQEIVKLRAETPIVSPQVFLNLDLVKNHPIPAEKITVASSYFLVETEVSIEDQHLVLYTLLERTTSEKKVTLRILWQSKGRE